MTPLAQKVYDAIFEALHDECGGVPLSICGAELYHRRDTNAVMNSLHHLRNSVAGGVTEWELVDLDED